MPIARTAHNEGIGSVELTLLNLSTTVAASLARCVRQADIDAGRNAVALIANNQVAICTTTRNLFGQAVACSTEITTKGEPKFVTVRVRGVCSLNGTTTLPTIVSHIACRNGKVAAISGTTATITGGIGRYRAPVVADVWDTDKIDVVL
jgi:hypothetical protein